MIRGKDPPLLILFIDDAFKGGASVIEEVTPFRCFGGTVTFGGMYLGIFADYSHKKVLVLSSLCFFIYYFAVVSTVYHAAVVLKVLEP